MISLLYSPLLILALLLYALGMLMGFGEIYRASKTTSRLENWLITGGFILHLLAFVLRFRESQALPVTNLHESLSCFALFLAGAYIWISRTARVSILGAFINPLTTVVMLWAVLITQPVSPHPPVLKSFWLPVHVIFSFAGNAMLAMTCGLGIMYLIQEHLIKTKRISRLFKRLPSLNKLDQLSYSCLSIGFPLLTLGIITGSIWASLAWGSYWSWDPKETWSLITWFLYAALLHGRINSAWRGKKAAILSIIGFGAIMFTFLGVNLLLSGLHAYAVR
ncbi:MAG: c-type cytochrome biogenesis protein CcsB [Deltaproteobacteria bacterium]|nr:c-type cytochrome biogenesis protein CcsB [Candidatus Anaeroferrophillus wilburensis]MBN2888030.1 c-type cytochrome biogenesis protein CcsB [Deltaproteobacteria bacterium]